MARVQMLVSITGGRGDGTQWPPAGGVLVTGDDEARQLIRGGMARVAPDEERAVMPVAAAETAGGAAGAVPVTDETPAAGNAVEGAPTVRDNKDVWVDHAVAQGHSAEVAAQMTKADLIAKFGTTPRTPA